MVGSVEILSARVVTTSIITGLLSVCCACSPAGAGPPLSRHVVVVVWDGMRPDFVNERDTPVFWKLAQDGVTFRNHHCVYPSATNVNGVALVTGAYPGHSGIIANHEYRPDIDNRNTSDVEIPEVVRKGDQLSGGKYVALPTIAELVRGAGAEAVIATAKTVGLLQDRHLDESHKHPAALFAGQMLSSEALARLVKLLGPFPPAAAHAQKDKWTTKALTDFFWKDGVPAFSLLWLGEPDASQHETAPGAEQANIAIKSADDNLGAALAALDRHGARSTTDIFVVSDHGFSTIEHSIDLRKVLKDAGFSVATAFSSAPKAGDVMLDGNGGTVFFYVVQHDAAVARRLVDFLQQSDFCGVILTREKLEGTFGFEEVKIDNEHVPDVAMAFRWTDKPNQFGIRGMIDADWQRAARKGTHATLSRFDMHNTLIATGPDIRRGQTSDLPSCNLDLAPTILRLLGMAPPRKMDGRILNEALIGIDASAPKPETKTIEAIRNLESGTWRQTLQTTRVGSTIYLDEGNG